MNLINVVTSRDRIVVDLDTNIAYSLREKYYSDEYLVKRFDAVGKDLRFIDHGGVDGSIVAQNSQEYQQIKAFRMQHEERALVGYGEYKKIKYPQGYEIAEMNSGRAIKTLAILS